jgi:hypothetical protein
VNIYWLQGVISLNDELLQACRELIDDAKMGCTDLVFKEISLEILSRARNVLTERQFRQLVSYATEKMKEKVPFELHSELALNR